MNVARVLVIEDEPQLRLLLRRLITDAGYDVSEAATGAAGLDAALAEDYDLILLDLMLPDIPGEDVLQVVLASRPSARVMVLSAVDGAGRRVDVLDGGAVDFVAKPFVNLELLARVRARIHTAVEPPPTSPRYVGGGGIRLDLHRRELVLDGRHIGLSQREFVLLAHLLQHRGQVCTRQDLLTGVWGAGVYSGANVVDVYVRRLRAKLALNTIETVRNVGYRFVA